MATFTPNRKQSDQFFPGGPVMGPSIPPLPTVPAPIPNNAHNKNDGFYHTPWDNKPIGSNRVNNDYGPYATSDEIQVLIQKMEHDRRQLNEGPAEIPVSAAGYIHVDDYKIKQPPNSNPGTLTPQTEIVNSGGMCDNFDDGKYRYVEDEVDDSEDEDDEEDVEIKMNGACGNVSMKLRPKVLNLEQLENMDSEDTGYRSVGSPDQVLVTEDDYLIPGSVKSASISSDRDARSPTVKSEPSTPYNVMNNIFKEDTDDDNDNDNFNDIDNSNRGAGTDILTRL